MPRGASPLANGPDGGRRTAPLRQGTNFTRPPSRPVGRRIPKYRPLL